MKVEVIAAKKKEELLADKRLKRMRVAAYCRVSTDEAEQLKSYNSMVQHYTNYIHDNKDWVFAGVYADRGITGTKTDKREEFQRMIQECMSGNIDLVIAKSISRFARNTLDTLQYVRLLKEHNVGIYFETEKINTLKDGEFLITILSSVAQQEVENISSFVKKGLKMKMKRGELVGFQKCLGYDYDKDTKTISVNPQEAVTVRYIFDRYIGGAGGTIIARELNEQGLTTIRGNPWTCSSVIGIIKNEKYKGDILQGKTITVDPISKRRLANFGEEEQFYVREHHDPIISAEVFDIAQQILKKRVAGRTDVGQHDFSVKKYSKKYAFSSVLFCGYCGTILSRRSWHANSKNQKTIWQCMKATKNGKKYCPDSKGNEEWIIEQAFLKSYKEVCDNYNEMMHIFLERMRKNLQKSDGSTETEKKQLEKRLSDLKRKRKNLLNNFLEGTVEKDIYKDTDNTLQSELNQILSEIDLLDAEKEKYDSLEERIRTFKKVLSEERAFSDFDRDVFECLVEKVIVGGYDEDGRKDPYKITFIYKTGFTNSISASKKKSRDFEMGLNAHDEIEDACTIHRDNECGDCVPLEQHPKEERTLCNS